MFTRQAAGVLAAAAATLAFATAAHAGDDPNRVYRTKVVSYADLDLATEEGAAKLDRRIRGAVNYVCGTPGRQPLNEVMHIQNCRTDAFASARRATVTLIAAAKSGTDLAAATSGSIAVGSR